MFKKFIFAAAALGLVAASFQSSALASDASITVRDHRTKVVVRDHRTTPGNEVVRVARKDCRLGFENLRRAGYEHISVIDCSGAKYKYLAKNNGGIYRALMNAYSGKLDIKFIGFGH